MEVEVVSGEADGRLEGEDLSWVLQTGGYYDVATGMIEYHD